MVILNVGFGVLPVPALVLTVWPFAKKPRPVVQDVGVARVKCLRAVMLSAAEQEPGRLVPTDHVWRYLGCQVLAVLDVEEAQLESGIIRASERSMAAIQRLTSQESGRENQGGAHPEGEEREESKETKKKTTIKAPSFKSVHRRLRQCALATEKKKVTETEKNSETRHPLIFDDIWG